jgi:hypothetical protein
VTETHVVLSGFNGSGPVSRFLDLEPQLVLCLDDMTVTCDGGSTHGGMGSSDDRCTAAVAPL